MGRSSTFASMPAGVAEARDAYEQTAPHYDAFTARYDSRRWLNNILALASACSLRRGRALELGCGTGRNFAGLRDHGFDAVGVDVSPAMLARARERSGGQVELIEADMSAIGRVGSFDLVACLDDGLNYLLTTQALTTALRSMRLNLAPEGLAIFDVNTLATYRTFFAETATVTTEAWEITWQGLSAADVAPGQICEATFSAIATDADEKPGASVVHRQRHYPLPLVEACAAAAGLEVVAVRGHAADAVLVEPPDELDHIKTVFVLRRKPR